MRLSPVQVAAEIGYVSVQLMLIGAGYIVWVVYDEDGFVIGDGKTPNSAVANAIDRKRRR
jgi:hypothetical protein